MPPVQWPQTKGTEVLNAVKWLRGQRERALALLPARLHKYLDERILVSSWYPEEDQLGLLRALVKLLPPTPEDPWITMGRSTANTNLSGLYRQHLRRGDPHRSMESAPVFWRNAHDTGEMSCASSAPGRLSVQLRGFARPSREMCKIVIGYCLEVVALSTGKTAIVEHDACVVDGANECSWSVSWT